MRVLSARRHRSRPRQTCAMPSPRQPRANARSGWPVPSFKGKMRPRGSAISSAIGWPAAAEASVRNGWPPRSKPRLRRAFPMTSSSTLLGRRRQVQGRLRHGGYRDRRRLHKVGRNRQGGSSSQSHCGTDPGAQADVKTAQAAVTSATVPVKDAEADLKAKTAAQSVLDAAKTDLASARGALTSANTALGTAERERNNAKRKLQDAIRARNAARATRAAAISARNRLQRDAQKIEAPNRKAVRAKTSRRRHRAASPGWRAPSRMRCGRRTTSARTSTRGARCLSARVYARRRSS